MDLSLKQYLLHVIAQCAKLDFNHGFPKHAEWWDAMKHIEAGLNLVACYSSDNAGCVSVNSAQN